MQKVLDKLSIPTVQSHSAQQPESRWAMEIIDQPGSDRGLLVREFIIGLLTTLFVAGATYVSLSFFWSKFSRAEVFFAECAREMLVTGNFITPLYHNQPFFDKPIFVYWLIIAMFKTLGVTHFAARVPSIFASITTIFCTAIAGSFLFGRRTGLTAAAMLASAFMYLSFSSLCMSDSFLILFDALSLIFIFAGMRFAKNRNLYWWLAAVSMGFGFLTKGPVGLVLPAASSLIYMGMTNKLHLVRASHIIWALVSITIIASPWFYAAYLANGQEALVHFFIQENIQRFAGTTYDVHKPFWYTIVSFFLGFAPWSILLPPALFCFYKNLREASIKLTGAVKVSDDLHYENSKPKASLSFKLLSYLPLELSAELFLWTWVFVAVGFFCFSRGKCDYYTLPAYPAAAILAAQYVSSYLKRLLLPSQLLALAIGISTIIFTAFVLPKINQLVPVNRYAAVIKNGPENLRVGIDNSLSSWADEILFQSGKDPQCLNEQQMSDFVVQREPFLLLMPKNKYDLLLQKLSSRKTKEWQVLSCDQVATHSLTPGYLISRGGNIADSEPLVLATNVRH